MARFVGRENVRKRLAPLEGEQGRTSYANGVVRIELPGEAIIVRPPFGLAHEHEYATVRLTPLLEALTDDHIVAALLVRPPCSDRRKGRLGRFCDRGSFVCRPVPRVRAATLGIAACSQ